MEQVVEGQSVVKEPVVGRLVVRIGFGMFVEVVRSVESQFVGELVARRLVVFERRTRVGRWEAVERWKLLRGSCLSSVR